MVARAGIQQPGGALLFGDCPSRGRLEDRTSFHGEAFLCGDFVCVCWWAGALTANSAAGSAVRGSSTPRRSVELAPARARPRLLAAENPGHPLRRQGTADQRRVKFSVQAPACPDRRCADHWLVSGNLLLICAP
jgi:hypothetical protein